MTHRCLPAEERPNHTLRSTELVDEAYLRLVDQRLSELQNRAHFFAVSAPLMREILADYARSRRPATDVLLRWTTRWQPPRSEISMLGMG